MKILSTDQIYQADKNTIQNKPITSIDLMEYAANQCFLRIQKILKNKNKIIHIFCGIGNNGGDGLVVARKLIKENYIVSTYIVAFSNKRSDDFQVNYTKLIQLGAHPKQINDISDYPKISRKRYCH